MPPRKKSVKSESISCGVRYAEIPGSRMNAIRLILPFRTTPHLINQMKCGCQPKFEDKNPIDTAAAAALLLTLNENLIVFKRTKNQMIEMQYLNAGAQMAISFALPAPMSSIR
jgi:hypothetical protein